MESRGLTRRDLEVEFARPVANTVSIDRFFLTSYNKPRECKTNDARRDRSFPSLDALSPYICDGVKEDHMVLYEVER